MSDSPEPTESNLIARFEKNKREEVRLPWTILMANNSSTCAFTTKGDAERMAPLCKQGLAISVERYHDLAEAVLTLGQHLQGRGLLGRGTGGT